MNPTHLVITNRQSEIGNPQSTGWIHIVPKGELPNREAGVVQVLDDTSLDSILANIAADKARLGERWPGIYAGREHFIYNDTQDSAALAWFKDFEKRADGIYASAAGLTDVGRDVVKNGHYKFTSFVADRRDTQSLGVPPSGGPARVRILKLDTVGFTNQANGKELLTPITNRAGDLPPGPADGCCPDCATKLKPNAAGDAQACPDCQKKFANADASAVNQNHNTKNRTMKEIATLLGLAAEASEAAVLAEVTKLKNRITAGDTAIADNTKYANRMAELEKEQVEGLLATHGVTDAKLVNRLGPVLTQLANREERVAALVDFGYPLPTPAAKAATGAGRILNRQDGKATATTGTGEGSPHASADKILNRAREIQHATKCNFDAAHAQAARELIKS